MRTPLKKNEKVLLVTRTSWIVLIVPILILLVNLVAAYFLVPYSNWWLLLPLIAFCFFAYKWMERMYNIWAVTNFRVIDEYGLININTKESPLDKINNVSYSQNIWGRLFKYGDVEIQTAATVGDTIYRLVENPGLLKDTITTAQADYKHSQWASYGAVAPVSFVGEAGAAANPANIGTELEKLSKLRENGILTEEEFQKAKTKLLQ